MGSTAKMRAWEYGRKLSPKQTRPIRCPAVAHRWIVDQPLAVIRMHDCVCLPKANRRSRVCHPRMSCVPFWSAGHTDVEGSMTKKRRLAVNENCPVDHLPTQTVQCSPRLQLAPTPETSAVCVSKSVSMEQSPSLCLGCAWCLHGWESSCKRTPRGWRWQQVNKPGYDSLHSAGVLLPG